MLARRLAGFPVRRQSEDLRLAKQREQFAVNQSLSSLIEENIERHLGWDRLLIWAVGRR